ncbi:MAG: hypothetical protein IK122_01230 [Alphaproteobacteria bacterium]|nr:hypothetical protein [Alphaproteobacteria bacterium]
MRSLVDTALNTAMGTLTETHGVPIKVIFADTDQSVVVRGIFNENGIINTMSQSGIPMESMEIQVGFRKTDFADKGVREPLHGDILEIPDRGTFRIYRRPTDDGIELTCGVKDMTNVGKTTTD